ncbi:MAG: rhodanese-like domain-containing protein [Gammaproteobacteria bacterium]
MTTRVTAVQAADSNRAAEHFESSLQFETDCWDVHDALSSGAPDFVLLDVRSPDAYRTAHIAYAVNLPHARIREEALTSYPTDKLFVVYCAGPHCNGAHRAAIGLARLRRPVKIMLGGIAGWRDEGFDLVAG